MQSTAARAGLAVALIAIAVICFVVLSAGSDGGGGADTATGEVPTIYIKNGKPVGGIKELDYQKGDQIHFRIRSDVSDEVHVHGYDLIKDVKAGGTISFDFPASLDGIYEAELEGRKEQIIELRVNP